MNWRPIKGYEGLYEVSDSGLIQSLDRYVNLPKGNRRFAKGRILKLNVTNRGYLDVRLNKDGKAKSFLVHRLVLEAFVPNPENYPIANHLSGDKMENTVENLKWTNHSGNALHAYQTGLNSNCGCTHSLAVPVIDTKTGEIYCTVKAFCAYFGINYNSARNALNGYQPFPKNVDLSGHNFEKYTC